MLDDTSVLESGAQTELPLENRQRSRAKSDSTVLSSLGLTAVDSGDSDRCNSGVSMSASLESVPTADVSSE